MNPQKTADSISRPLAPGATVRLPSGSVLVLVRRVRNRRFQDAEGKQRYRTDWLCGYVLGRSTVVLTEAFLLTHARPAE